jgi:FkbM family methyltransferase
MTTGLRAASRRAVNALLGLAGLRMVARDWGPNGTFPALERMRALGFQPRAIFDIGASDGRWSLECMKLFPASRYFLADPLPENRTALDRLVAMAPGTVVWHGAIGAEDGPLELHLHGDQSSFLPSRDFDGERQVVAVRTLDTIIDAHSFDAPLLLKTDVQGHELEILRGAERCLAMAEAVVLETSIHRLYRGNPLAHEVVSTMGDRGFRLYDVCTYVQRPADRSLAQTDLMFVSAGSRLFAHEGWR